MLNLSNEKYKILAEDIYLRPPSLLDYNKWRLIREESRNFLTPWEPTWQTGEHTLKRYIRLITIYSRRRRSDSQYSFFIFDKNDQLLGGINVFNIKRGISQSCTIGYWIGKKYSNKGYMTKALSILIVYLFNQYRVNRIEAACLPSNNTSIKLLLRLGFSKEGYATDYLRINGRWEDHLLFAITKKKYDLDKINDK
ncbi:MAG: 30S ribosomal protein S5 alanine N-acetyltransferase [Rhodobiaceae bacterium]|nr:30S ribosomal protein S5 alanine N-acetyltransferase [Rhodobiaceae bacterium]